MKADNKISIKVKSKTERRIMEQPELEMISEWNYKRIIYALIVIIILVIIPAYYLSSTDNSDIAPPPLIKTKLVIQDAVIQAPPNKLALDHSSSAAIPKQAPVKETVSATVIEKISTSNSSDDIVKETVSDVQSISEKELITDQASINEPAQSITKEEVQEELVVQKVQQAISHATELNSHISRAQLAQGVNKLEPYGNIELPLLVDTIKAYSVTYFTEVNNMQGDIVFHEWLQEGNSVYKRKINIRGNRWRISTSKLFPYNSTGQWQVRIITQQGDVLNKVDFSVEKR